MKRFLTLALALCMLLALSGCVVKTGTKEVKLHKGSLDTAFTALELDIDVGDVVVEPGDRFYVKYALCHEPEIETNDGVLTIREKAEEHWWENIHFGKSNQPFVMVTVPADAEIRGIDVTVDVGDVKVTKLEVGALDLKSDVGDLDVQSVTVGFTAALSSDVGNIDCSEMTVGSALSLETDTGDISFAGSAAALDAESDVGSVTLALSGAAADWAMTLRTDAGDVKVDGHDQGNRCETAGEPYVLTAGTDVGDIDVTFAG